MKHRGPANHHPERVLDWLLPPLAACLVYSNALHGQFQYDDVARIDDNRLMHNPDGWVTLVGNSRFLPLLSFWFQAQSTRDPFPFHVVNVAIHAVNSLLVLALWRRAWALLGGPERTGRNVALLAALVFAVHPLQTQAVTYIWQRVTSLCALFYLGSAHAYLAARSRARARVVGPVLSIGACVAAMLSKEIGFTVPFTLVALEALMFARGRRYWTLAAVAQLTLPVLALADVDAREEGSGPLEAAAHITRLDYLRTQAVVAWKYARLLAWPTGQNLDPDEPVRTQWDVPVIAGMLGVLLVGAAALWLCTRTHPRRARRDGEDRRRLALLRMAGAGVAWFFITMSVESSFIPIGDVMLEHRLYLPAAGLWVSVAALLALLTRRVDVRATGFAAALVLAALGVTTVERNRAWDNHVALWGDALAGSPEKARVHFSLGVSLFLVGLDEEAEMELMHAVDLWPCDWRGYVALTQVEKALQRPEVVEVLQETMNRHLAHAERYPPTRRPRLHAP